VKSKQNTVNTNVENRRQKYF